MSRFTASLAFVLLALASPFAFDTAFAATRVSEPEAVVRAIYEAYGPESFPEDPYDAYFSPTLLKLWNEVDEGAGDDLEYAIDFDVFLDAQDVDTVTDVSTTLQPKGKDGALVDITFTAFGEQKTMHYTLVKLADGWKIDNLDWGPDRADLRALLEDLKKQQKAH